MRQLQTFLQRCDELAAPTGDVCGGGSGATTLAAVRLRLRDPQAVRDAIAPLVAALVHGHDEDQTVGAVETLKAAHRPRPSAAVMHPSVTLSAANQALPRAPARVPKSLGFFTSARRIRRAIC